MRVITTSLFLIVTIVLGNCKPRNADTLASPYIVSCPPTGGAPADVLTIPTRAGYILNYQGDEIENVHYFAGTDLPGMYNLTLTVRDGSFAGTVLGTSNINVPLPPPGIGGYEIIFTFSPPIVVPQSGGNRTVTFEVSQAGGGTVYGVFETFTSSVCQMVETTGNTPPLGTPNGSQAWAVIID